MGKWKEMTWGDLATLAYGKSLRDYRESEGEFRVYGTNGPIGWHNTPLCYHPGIIVGRKGAYRGIHFSPKPFFVIDTAFYLNPVTKFDMKWAYYQLLTQDINGMDSGSAIPSTNRESFYNLPVKVPTLPEQRAIAHILGTLDDKIEMNRRMNKTLEEMAKALFKSWFIDFDPVRAKMEGKPTGLPKEIEDLFPDKLVWNDELEKGVPEGWESKKLKEVVTVNGKTIRKESFQQEYIKYIDISSVTKGKLSGVTEYYFKEAPSRARRLVNHGDTIWSCVRPNRRSFYLILRPDDNIVVSTGFAVLTPKKITSVYLYIWVTTDEFVDYLSTNADGSAYPAVRGNHFKMADILLPSSIILEQFQSIIMPIYDQIATNDIKAKTLASLRDILIPKLISGRMRIPNMKKIIGEAEV